MVQQAAAAIARAQQAGLSRQWVRLRLDMAGVEERLSDNWQWDAQSGWTRMPLPPAGVTALHEASLPMVEQLARSLGAASPCKQLKVALIDEEDSPDIGTLVYREAEDSKGDVALFFLAGRPFAVAESTTAFLNDMKERLVVVVNSEDAASTFKVENRGEDFRFSGFMWKVGEAAEFCDTFRAQTYHYSSATVNGWMTLLFRVYPHPWELYIEGISGEVTKLREAAERPSIPEIVEYTIEYEQANDVTPMAKKEISLRNSAR